MLVVLLQHLRMRILWEEMLRPANQLRQLLSWPPTYQLRHIMRGFGAPFLAAVRIAARDACCSDIQIMLEVANFANACSV